jgi:membrane associated rhomboid family serine protease
MGLSDRHYAKSERSMFAHPPAHEPPQLGGRPTMWSVNTWLIAVNVAIFAFMVFFGRALPTPIVVQALDFDRGRYEVIPALLRANGDPVKPGERLVVGEPYFRTLREKGTNLIVVNASTGGPIAIETLIAADPVTAYGHFSTTMGFERLQVWRLVTFQFVHGGVGHLFFNMFGLFTFGRAVEERLGGRKYLAYYLVCGIFGGLAYLALNIGGIIAMKLGAMSVPGLLFHDSHTTLVGASAGVFGVIVACARLFPKDEVTVLFIPSPIRLRVLAYAYVAIAAVNLFIGGNNAGGDAAHLGGALAGFYFIVRPHLLTDFFDVFTDSRKGSSPPPPPPPAEQVRGKVDQILAKVEREGLQSLTASEREELQAESKRLKDRDR